LFTIIFILHLLTYVECKQRCAIQEALWQPLIMQVLNQGMCDLHKYYSLYGFIFNILVKC